LFGGLPHAFIGDRIYDRTPRVNVLDLRAPTEGARLLELPLDLPRALTKSEIHEKLWAARLSDAT
jgi:hypothetical protein